MTEPLISIQGVGKSYPGVTALSNISMDFNSGEIVGLVGQNGAGKSTLIRILSGVERPSEGALIVNNQELQFLKRSDAQKYGFAFVHQELNDIATMSIGENICLGLGFPRSIGPFIDRKGLNDRARSALAKINWDIDPDTPVSQLSVAERRLVMIARALANEARLLVLDEPTASLSDSETAELIEVLKLLRSEGVCIVYVSHRLEEILCLTDRVVVLRDGKFVKSCETADLDKQKLVSLITADSGLTATAGKQTKSCTSTSARSMQFSNLDPLRIGEKFSIEVYPGEVLGVTGLVGAGRTETVQQILGQTKCTHQIANQLVSIENPQQALANGIACVPEDRRHFGILGNLNISENITISCLKRIRRIQGIPFMGERFERSLATEYFERLSVKASSLNSDITTLSGGNQQKVLLARCLAAEAQLLILDEPTHGVDVGAKAEIYEIINELAANGKSILLISSDLPELVALSDRAIVLNEGRKVGEYSGAELNEKTLLGEFFNFSKTSQTYEQ